MRSDEIGFRPLPDVPLAPLSTLRVGGPARWYARATDRERVAAAHAWCVARDEPLLVLGGGSNVVVADEGFPGLVLHVELRGLRSAARDGDTSLSVAAGEPWDTVVEWTVARGLAGLECLSGIPGRTGGTPIQNVGAYGQEVAHAIEAVEVYDRVTGSDVTLPGEACGFAYRTSRFKEGDAERYVVCGVRFRLRPGPPTVAYPDVREWLRAAARSAPTLADVRQAVLEVRRRKGMVLDAADPETQSAGSFFTNPVMSEEAWAGIARAAGVQPPRFAAGEGRVKVPAAWLIERAGFAKGWTDGAAGVSRRHPLAIVNRGGARARDIVGVALRIARTVEERFGVRLRAEPVFVGFGRDPDVAWLSGRAGHGAAGGAV